ncbi:MAG TPA: NAD(P)/FAD-dependent oxidoreductase, partial [Pyrinomonadaceae bacterium]|nr:NAD(P)/FAD-dependent oxidoreductase [Pyrinomonadaceae bacterium]
KGNKEITADAFIAADGAGSQIRRSLLLGGVERFDYMQSWLAHGYKELTIPPRNGDFALEPNALHIWPRHSYMMIALPNLDRSFTCTLFLSHSKSGQTPGFDQFHSAESVKDFFKAEFEDAFDLMPGLVEDFFNHPTGNLGTVRCSPWHVEDRLLLIGDAAHAIVPFYGQGMNCAFEDVRILDEMIEQHEGDWQQLFQKFESERKPNTDAIAELAEENFYEMRDATADPVFIRKRELETKLESLYQDFYSKYSMVTFRDDLPYHVAKVLGNEQDRLLTEIAASCEDIGQLDLEEVISKIRQFYDKAAALK